METKQLTISVISTSGFQANWERTSLFPISRGPYAGMDYIQVEAASSGRFGKQSVRRVTLQGEVVADYGETESFQAACLLVQDLITEQSNKDCRAVTGNGRWSA